MIWIYEKRDDWFAGVCLGQLARCPYLLGYCLGGDVGAGPCVLEIEASCDGVDVDYFASEVEVLVALAFHCFEIDFF